MNKIFKIDSRIWFILGPIILAINVQLVGQSNLELAKIWIDSAKANDGNFEKIANFAQKGADYARKAKVDSLVIQAQFLNLRAANYLNDSLLFYSAFQEAEDLASANKDTASLLFAYYSKGIFHATQGNNDLAISTFRYILNKRWYNQEGLSTYTSILGALVDLSIIHDRNLDSTLFYINKLLNTAKTYNDPGAYVVGYTKMGFVTALSYNYAGSVKQLRNAYQYLDAVESRGYLFYFYNRLIQSFLGNDQLDSAQHYLTQFEQKVDYDINDPRHCWVTIAKARIAVNLGHYDILNEDFEGCYDYATNVKSKNKLGLDAMLVKCKSLLKTRQLAQAEQVINELLKRAKALDYLWALEKGYNLKSRIHVIKKEYLEAHAAQKERANYIKQINWVTFENGVNLLETQADLSVKKQENKVLLQEKENALLQDKRKNLILVSTSIFSLLTLAIIFLLLKNRKDKKQQRAQLEQMVQKRTAELENSNNSLVQANKKLSISNAELERFAFVASHDMKEPLRNIMNFSELLRRSLPADDAPGPNTYMNFIQQGAKNMYTLIEDILEYSTVRTEENFYQCIKPCEIIREVIYSLRNFIDEREVEFKCREFPTIVADKRQLYAIFNNLIINGIKYNKSTPPIISFDHWADADYNYFSVADNGIGIHEKYHDRIFKLFHRLHHKAAYDGTGIGLAIVKKMVEQHQGKIWLESQENKGSKFIFSIHKNLEVNKGQPHLIDSKSIESDPV